MPYEIFKDGFQEHGYLLDVRWDTKEAVTSSSSVVMVVTEFDRSDHGKPKCIAFQLADPSELRRLEKAIRRARNALENREPRATRGNHGNQQL